MSDAIVERVVPTVEPATALAALPLVVEEPPQADETELPRVEELPQIEEPPPVEELPQVEEPREVEQPRASAASQNGNHVHVQQEVPAVEPVAIPDTTRVDEIVAAPNPRKADALPKEGWERCAVSCWRGYVTAQFYAHRAGEEAAIATSSAFEWRAWQRAPRDAQAAQAALDELHELLEIAGWEAVGRGDAWYELRFQREPPVAW